jgi:hypothetical protein
LIKVEIEIAVLEEARRMQGSFVDREAEIDRLTTLAEEVRAATPRVVLVHGPPA